MAKLAIDDQRVGPSSVQRQQNIINEAAADNDAAAAQQVALVQSSLPVEEEKKHASPVKKYPSKYIMPSDTDFMMLLSMTISEGNFYFGKNEAGVKVSRPLFERSKKGGGIVNSMARYDKYCEFAATQEWFGDGRKVAHKFAELLKLEPGFKDKQQLHSGIHHLRWIRKIGISKVR